MVAAAQEERLGGNKFAGMARLLPTRPCLSERAVPAIAMPGKQNA